MHQDECFGDLNLNLHSTNQTPGVIGHVLTNHGGNKMI